MSGKHLSGGLTRAGMEDGKKSGVSCLPWTLNLEIKVQPQQEGRVETRPSRGWPADGGSGG